MGNAVEELGATFQVGLGANLRNQSAEKMAGDATFGDVDRILQYLIRHTLHPNY
jgi:hypothetical protein